jgi:SAM-dependent methyltransferase
LHERGYTCIDGVDLSNKLLDAVPNEIYQTLFQADLNYSLDVPDSYYDAVICVGTFTYGHVKANALAEFIRITNHEGFICFTVNEGIFVEQGFKAKLADLETEDRWVRRELFKSDYLASKNVNAWLGLYQVKKC